MLLLPFYPFPLSPMRMSSGFETGEIVSVFITAREIVDDVEINFPFP
jgi:hypothetical protein